jgi:hypothetical protein
MTNTNPPKERGTAHTDNDPEATARRLAKLLQIAELAFQRHQRMLQFGREIEEANQADEGRERTRHQAFLDEYDKPPHRPGWRFYQTPDIGYQREFG